MTNWKGTAFAALAWAALLLPASALAQEKAEPEAPAYSKAGADTCLNCHGDNAVVMAIFRTKHAQPGDPRTPFGHGQLQCEACHGPGGAHTKRPKKGEERAPVVQFGRGKASTTAEQNAMCLGCHNPNLGDWHASVHQDNEVGCADCHDSHAARDPVLSRVTQGEVCRDCHQLQTADTMLPFAHPLHEGQMACSSCHVPHGSLADASLKKDTINETCYTCHADKRGPFLWEHQPVGEDCTLCHKPHGSAQPAMLTQRSPFLCQQCHQAQGHPSVPGLPSGLPDGSPSVTLLASGCANCHSQVHGSNHPSGARLTR
jgi:DmsE family decaheme c-type cytochrome